MTALSGPTLEFLNVLFCFLVLTRGYSSERADLQGCHLWWISCALLSRCSLVHHHQSTNMSLYLARSSSSFTCCSGVQCMSSGGMGVGLWGIFFLGGFSSLGLLRTWVVWLLHLIARDLCEGNCLIPHPGHLLLHALYQFSGTRAKPNVFLCYVSNLYFDTSTTDWWEGAHDWPVHDMTNLLGAR